MPLTPTSQRNAVSEGMALGLAMAGRFKIPRDKLRVDGAFTAAFRAWQYSDRFPQVGTDVNTGLDGIWAMTRAGETKRTFALFWDSDGPELVIYARQTDFDLTDQADLEFALEVIGGGVPLEGWVSLAQAFLERLDH